MVRTQIQLPQADYDQLKKVAARERRSLADCIREGVRLFLKRSRGNSEDLSDIAGKFRPLSMEGLKPHDRWLAEAVIRSKGARRKG